MASSNSSPDEKSCACAYIAFLAGIFSCYADSTQSSQFDTRIELSGVSVRMFIRYFYKVQKYTCIGKYVSVCCVFHVGHCRTHTAEVVN
jgi:hypothetical protein